MPKDFINAAGSFGEGFLKTLQSERERKQKELEFNQKMAFETRQMNLMNQVYQQRQALDEAQSFVNVGKDDVYNKLGVPEGKYHTSLMDNLISGYGKTETTPTYDIEGSYKNDKTGTYWTYDKGTGQPKDLGIPFDRNEGRSITTNNSSTQESTTPYVNFDSVDEMIRNYNKRTDKGVAVGNSIVPIDEWRIKANEQLEKNLRDTGISQEVSDKIWGLAGIKDNDDAVMKRKKLKNVLDQQTQLPDFQKRALYQMVEVRTR